MEQGDLHPVAMLSADREGAQGWFLSIESRGDCELVSATTDGTIGASVAPGSIGLRDAGFENTEVVSPEDNAGRAGVVSAVVLSFASRVMVPVGEHPILAMRVSFDTGDAADGDLRSHRLFYPSNLGAPPYSGPLRGSGQPVDIAVTFQSNTVEPGVSDAQLSLAVRVPHIARFLRCDPNDDGSNNLADVIWLVNELFRSGTVTRCRAAADCNGDEMVDLSDAVFAIE